MNHTVALKIRKSEEAILEDKGFTFSQCIGEGQYSKVYLADYCPKNEGSLWNEKLACKIIDGTRAPSEFLRKFLPRELDLLSKIDYVYCVQIHSILQRRYRFYVFMEFCHNGDLLDFIRKRGPATENLAKVWCTQILKGLNYLKERRIIHRDLKCENILLTQSYNIKICDYGFCKEIIPGDGYSDTFCGSIAYAAPEIIRGKSYDPEMVDTWSLGVILFVMINKSLPFDDTNLKTLYEHQINMKWKLREKVEKKMSSDLKKFLHILLEPNPEHRLFPSDLLTHPWIHHGPETNFLDKKNSALMMMYPHKQRPTIDNDSSLNTIQTDSVMTTNTAGDEQTVEILTPPIAQEAEEKGIPRTNSLIQIHKHKADFPKESKHTFFMDNANDYEKKHGTVIPNVFLSNPKIDKKKIDNKNVKSLVKNVTFDSKEKHLKK